MSTSPAIVVALCFLAGVLSGEITFLIYVNKPYVAIATILGQIVLGLLAALGVKIVQSNAGRRENGS